MPLQHLRIGGRSSTARRPVGLLVAASLAAIVAARIVEAAQAQVPAPPVATVDITLSTKSVAKISPLLYGVNFVWHQVPAFEFGPFTAALQRFTHYTLARYPGGWAAEHFDWNTNVETSRRAPGGTPGIDPENFLRAVPGASFVTPSAEAIADPSRVPEFARRAADLVRRFGKRVKIWEIGNEWWMQRGARSNPGIRRQNLKAYAALVAAAAPAMKAVNAGIEVYATGDWTQSDEFAALRRMVGNTAWRAIDGISIHSYCGPTAEQRACSRLIDVAAAIRSITGKTKIYDSEWSVAKRLAPYDYGIHNAGETILAFQDLAFANAAGAAYWPAVRSVPAIALIDNNLAWPTATGLAFGWMAQYYRGEALRTGGGAPAVAAEDGHQVTLIVPTSGFGPRIVRVALAGTRLSRVVSAEIMYSDFPTDRLRSRFVRIEKLPVSVRRAKDGKDWAEFLANPGTPGRGAGWEIARVTLQ